MRLTVLGSGSAGNGYLLEARHSALVIECGVQPEVAMRSGMVPSLVAGCLVSHEHRDHAGYVARYANLGLAIYASAGTLANVSKVGQYARTVTLKPMQPVNIGDFTVWPFDVRHDAAEPMGFIVEHPESGRILFLTDTRICPYNLRGMGLSHVLVEANYDDHILDGNEESGLVSTEQAERTRRTHMSLRQACELVRADQTADLENVVLIHLSSRNADPAKFARKMGETALFAKVSVAVAGLSIDLTKGQI